VSAVSRRPGAPLAALIGVILLWIAGRAALWETPLLPRPPAMPLVDNLLAEIETGVVEADPSLASGQSATPGAGLEVLALEAHNPETERARGAPPGPAGLVRANLPQMLGRAPNEATAGASSPLAVQPSFRLSASLPSSPSPGRWAADAWAFVRRGGAGSAVGAPTAAAYGASQVGAVVRYRLAPTGPTAPAAYLRATTTLDGRPEYEAAAGLAARPITTVPVVAMAEARLLKGGGRSELRPAILLVSEFPPLPLGERGKAEGYVQTGYVGGRFATAFVDGQVQVTRVLIKSRGVTVSAGAGAWGGAQRGTSRIDVGPTASVQVPLGRASARLAIDYRFRAAGDARPNSGPAMTISTGF